jgi:hypothetical protein
MAQAMEGKKKKKKKKPFMVLGNRCTILIDRDMHAHNKTERK